MPHAVDDGNGKLWPRESHSGEVRSIDSGALCGARRKGTGLVLRESCPRTPRGGPGLQNDSPPATAPLEAPHERFLPYPAGFGARRPGAALLLLFTQSQRNYYN